MFTMNWPSFTRTIGVMWSLATITSLQATTWASKSWPIVTQSSRLGISGQTKRPVSVESSSMMNCPPSHAASLPRVSSTTLFRSTTDSKTGREKKLKLTNLELHGHLTLSKSSETSFLGMARVTGEIISGSIWPMSTSSCGWDLQAYPTSGNSGARSQVACLQVNISLAFKMNLLFQPSAVQKLSSSRPPMRLEGKTRF